ncbi:MAG TPA: YlxR family protein [Candidatus Limnocylindrales bacterium]
MACRTARPKRDLLRVVRAPDGTVAIDPTGRAPGRGAYLCRDAACWDTAARKRALEHALKTPVPATVVAALVASPVGADQPNPIAGALSPASTIDTDHQGGTRGQE